MEHVRVITYDFDSLCALCGSIHNLPKNDNINLIVDRFNVPSLHDYLFDDFHWC